MKLEISKNDLVKMIIKQLDHFFNIDKETYEHCLVRWSDEALQRCEKNFDNNCNKYYNIGGGGNFFSVPFRSIYAFFILFIEYDLSEDKKYKNTNKNLLFK